MKILLSVAGGAWLLLLVTLALMLNGQVPPSAVTTLEILLRVESLLVGISSLGAFAVLAYMAVTEINDAREVRKAARDRLTINRN